MQDHALDIEALNAMLALCESLPCWRAYVAFGNSPGLHLGDKIKKAAADAMMKHPRWKDRPESWFCGEVHFIIWCSWRLDAEDRPISSSDDAIRASTAAITSLNGTVLRRAVARPPAGDLELLFSNGQCLRVFCDHIPGEPSFHGNWELWVREAHVMVGPGSVCSFSDKEREED